MTTSEIISSIVGYYSAEVISLYRDQSDKYVMRTDYFEGEIRTKDGRQDPAESAADSYMNVDFGFRSRSNGDLALAVYLPSLGRASAKEQAKWFGFQIHEADLCKDPDPPAFSI